MKPKITIMKSSHLKSEKMFSFEDFCRYFGINKPKSYAPIVDAYIQYVFDFTYGGYVPPDDYFSKE